MRGHYLARRVGTAIVTIVLIVLVNFVLFRAMPGSPERVIGRNPNVTPELLAQTRAKWGFDKPLFPDQFVRYLASTAQLDLGFTSAAGRSSMSSHRGSGRRSCSSAWVRSSRSSSGWRSVRTPGGGAEGPIDYLGNGLSLILYSTPYFLLGMAFLLIFVTGLGWFPTFGMVTSGVVHAGPLEWLTDVLAHLALPLATVSLGLVGQYAIVMRSSVIETLSEDYVTTARAMGLDDRRILSRHALPNAMLPTVTLIGINLGYVVAGAITVEVVFNWPGLGTLTVDALSSRDYGILQGVFLLLSVAVVIANLLADIVYGLIDPRVRS